jgi:hypothetical protein
MLKLTSVNYKKENFQCKTTCATGFYAEIEDNTCKVCDVRCSTCSGSAYEC